MSKHGIIYVIQNDIHPANLYKIGYTTKSLDDRLRELNRETSNPGKFRAYGCYPVSDVKKAEKLCHQTLEQLGYRRRKEFFRGSLDRILAEVEGVTALFQPKAHSSTDRNYEEAAHDKATWGGCSRQGVMKCNGCDGYGKTRKQRGFLSIETTCASCGGSGQIWV